MKNIINKTKEKLDYKYVIIIILLIIIFLLLVRMSGTTVQANVLTGNMDIFDIKCECDKVNGTCENKSEEEIIKTDDNKKITIKKDDTTTAKDNTTEKDTPDTKSEEETTPGFNVYDDSIKWKVESELRIFENSAYTFDSIIAPGTSNSYEFRVRNNNDFNVKYFVKFDEENLQHINMKYRLKYKNSYIKGSDTQWLTYNELNVQNIVINTYSFDEYVLEWKWFESENDTMVGVNANSKYKLLIDITGVEYEE